MPIKRPSYSAAVSWLLDNQPDAGVVDELSIPEALVADLFGVSPERLVRDLRRLATLRVIHSE
jgi:hypothetical protein